MLKRFLSGALKVLITVTFTVFLVALFCILSFIIYAVKDKGLDVSELSALAKAQDRTTKLYYIENEKCDICKEYNNKNLPKRFRFGRFNVCLITRL